MVMRWLMNERLTVHSAHGGTPGNDPLGRPTTNAAPDRTVIGRVVRHGGGKDTPAASSADVTVWLRDGQTPPTRQDTLTLPGGTHVAVTSLPVLVDHPAMPTTRVWRFTAKETHT